jgi:hypothetical protein
VGFVHANWVFGPTLRKEQVHVDGQVLKVWPEIDAAHVLDRNIG